MGNRSSSRKRLWFLLCILLVTAHSAQADMGAPMIFFSLPYLVIGLVPIVGIEAWILRRGLRVSGWRTPVKVSVLANLVTTFLGVPVTWIALVFLGMLSVSMLPDEAIIGGYGLQSLAYVPWLPPGWDTHKWWIPAAHLILLVPFFLASWLIEFLVASRMLRGIPIGRVNRSVLLANIASYSLLAAIGVYHLITAIYQYSNQ